MCNVYSSRHYDADRALYAAFEEATGVQVRALTGSAEQLLERLRAEGDATEADLFVSADAGNLWRVKDADLLPERDDARARSRTCRRSCAIRKARSGASPSARASSSIARTRVQPATVAYLRRCSRLPRFRRQDRDALARPTSISSRRWPRGSNASARRMRARGRQACAPISCAIRKAATPIRSRPSPPAKRRRRWCNHYYCVPHDAVGRSGRSRTSPTPSASSSRIRAGAGTHVNISGGGVTAHAKRRDERGAVPGISGER